MSIYRVSVNRAAILSLIFVFVAFFIVSQSQSVSQSVSAAESAKSNGANSNGDKSGGDKSNGDKSGGDKKIKVLFFHGGHEFDEPEMYEMLDNFKDIAYDKAEMPKDAGLIKPGLEKDYDCLVMYDFYTFPYTKEQIENFKELLDTGIGLVVMHHSVGGYEFCDDYPEMIGGKYVTAQEAVVGGKTFKRSTWEHDQIMDVVVECTEHPIMNGVKDFTIHDETYGGVYVHPKSHVLMTTDNPKSTRELAWTKKYGKSHVFATLLGHDKMAYQNPNFSRMIHQAIRWSAEKAEAE